MSNTDMNAAMSELLESNRRRRKIRRWIGIGSIPLVLIAAVLVVKILSMYVFAHQAIRSFVAMDFGQSVAMSQWQGPLNWFEEYKADYNLGTSLAEVGELDEARAALERAVLTAPGLEVCAVRYNLGTVVERQGDRATSEGDEDTGQQLYRDALDILAAAPEGCTEEFADAASPDRERPMGESLTELIRRIMEKLKQEQNQNQNQNGGDGGGGSNDDSGEGEEDPPPSEQTPDESQLDELKQKLENGAEERRQREQGQSGGSGSGGGTDKPW